MPPVHEHLEWYFLVFSDSKVDLGDLNGKTLGELARNFYYWLPKHLVAERIVKEKSCAKKEVYNLPVASPQLCSLQMW
jgi:hypothetical protein